MHLLFETQDEPGQVVAFEIDRLSRLDLPAPSIPRRTFRLDQLQDVGNPLTDGLGVDTVLLVLLCLSSAAAVGLIDRLLHRLGDVVGIHDDLPVDVSGGPADDLDQ